MLKPLVLHGVGKVLFTDFLTGREVLRITRHESASWVFSYDEVTVSGGDDLDIYDSFETGRAQSVTFVDTRFDVRQLEPVTGKRAVAELNVPIVELGEGATIPDPAGPYTVTLDFASVTDDDSVRIRFGQDWEDLAPVPTKFTDADNVEETNDGAGTFLNGEVIDIRITAVLKSGIESVATTAFTHTIVATVSADLEVTAPKFVLDLPTGMPNYDVNELDGFNVYVDDGTAPEYLANATPLIAEEAFTLPATPGAGAASPDTTPTVSGQYTVTSGVITFADADASKEVFVDYIWRTSSTIAECTVVDILKGCLRNYLHAIWRVNVRAQDGSVKGLEMDIFKLKYSGDYTLDFSRSDASTHSMEFTILDPERADGKLVSWKFFPLPADTGCN